jgi:hypothetical protein
MKKLILTSFFSLITLLLFSQSIVFEFHDFDPFSSEKILKIKNPNQVLYDNTVKMYGNQPCDIKYEILVKEKIILFFNHGDLVDSKYLKSFEKSDDQIKFSFLLKEWNMDHEELTTVLVTLDESSSFQNGIIFNSYNNETNGMLVKHMGVIK